MRRPWRPQSSVTPSSVAPLRTKSPYYMRPQAYVDENDQL